MSALRFLAVDYSDALLAQLVRLCQIAISIQAGSVLRQRTWRAARCMRQTGNRTSTPARLPRWPRMGGPSPGQVTDLAGAVHTSRTCGFPRRRAVRSAARFRPLLIDLTKSN